MVDDAVVVGGAWEVVVGGCDGRRRVGRVGGGEEEQDEPDAGDDVVVVGEAESGRTVRVGAVVCSMSSAVVGASLLVSALRGWEVVGWHRRWLVRMLVVVLDENEKKEAVTTLPAGKRLLVVVAAPEWAARAVELGWPGRLEKLDCHEPVQGWDWLERAKGPGPGQHRLREGRAVVPVVFALVVPSSAPRASR